MRVDPYRTILVPEFLDSIDHSDKILMLGSCFSEHIGEKLIDRKFNVVLNPFGILYHPMAISAAVKRLIDNKPFGLKDLRFVNNRYVSFYHHGKFNHPDAKTMLTRINQVFETGRNQLLKANYLFVTWGTAFGYSYKEASNAIVANCHKISAEQFVKQFIQPDEIILEYRKLLEQILTMNPTIKIIISVSPVKHLKEGLVNNNISKSALLIAANQLKTEIRNTSYFPAYELVHDDLRDYRFYAKDMAHPSDEAVNYVWKFFKKTYWNKETLHISKKIESVLNALQHRPLHPENEEHQNFIRALNSKINELEQQYPFLDFSSTNNRPNKFHAIQE